jgi:hypothetical protein
VLNVRNGSLLVKGGALQTDCGCCFPPCIPATCSDVPSQLLLTVSAPEESGQPWVDTSGTFFDNFFGAMTKRETITFPAMSETIVIDLRDLGSNTSFIPKIQGQFLEVFLPTSTGVLFGNCSITARSTQVGYTLQGQAGQDAYTGYAYESRGAEIIVGLSSSSVANNVRLTKTWRGMGYAASNTSNFPFEQTRATFVAPSFPAECRSFPSDLSAFASTTASRGGFYDDLIGNNGQFCLVPEWDGTTTAPQVGQEYGYMVGFVGGCNRRWFGEQIRVAGLQVDISAEFQ